MINTAYQKKFDSLYRKNITALQRKGNADCTIDVYARAVRRITEFWDASPDILTQEQLERDISLSVRL